MGPNIPELLRIGDRIAVLPIIHGSGQCALAVRRWMLENEFDVVAVPLPPSFREAVEAAVLELPKPSIVIQPTQPELGQSFDGDPPFSASTPFAETFETEADEPWRDYGDEDDDDEEPVVCSYVPIDPCQPVIMAIRAAMGEHVAREYIDLETDPFLPFATEMPDPYALRTVAPEKFAAALLPGIGRPPDDQTRDRIRHMAFRLRELQQTHRKILFVTSVLYWPWIREAYSEFENAESDNRASDIELPVDDEVLAPESYDVDPRTLVFLFDEIPFITGLYERARAKLEDDENLSVDGVKELLLAARDSYRSELGNRARRITPMLLSQCLKYIRNLSLMHRRMTPDLATIVIAAKQIMGDQYAIHVVERARDYYGVVGSAMPAKPPFVTLGIDIARLPSSDTISLVNRLPGPPRYWQTIHLNRRPTRSETQRWSYRWNPFGQCSYPPEDEKIESFRTRVLDRAKEISGADLARTEKFTTSVKDGIDIRDTLRHWYEKQIYVKVLPPSRGDLDACVMIFDSPADPRHYPWRTTWFAEHKDESTLAFYATNFQDEMVGPGIALATYGGAMFLYPPIHVEDVWDDRRIDFATTLEERLIAAACLHSRAPQVALLSALPPGGAWRRLARHFKKHLIHVPLGSFSDEQVQQMRMVHVLNGRDVRSYADDFIRKI
ncbi:MAG: hypothetical protein ACO1RT_16005 [Planctomycetaceae bacterium]